MLQIPFDERYKYKEMNLNELTTIASVFILAGIIYLIFRGRTAPTANNQDVFRLEGEKAVLAEKIQAANLNTEREFKLRKESDERGNVLQNELATAKQTCAQLTERAKRLAELEAKYEQLSKERDGLLKDHGTLRSQIAQLNTTVENEKSNFQEKLLEINNAREILSNQFKAIAGEILDEKSAKFTEQNKVNLSQILVPLQEKIGEFKAKVEEVYLTEGKDRSAMKEQVQMLTQMNSTLSQDTKNLTLALTGNRKAQGNMGEIILDDVLQRAGLREGEHYVRQTARSQTEDGQKRDIPDVVVNLPGNRHLVIDSKMSMPDYQLFTTTDNEEERANALERHLISIRSHIKGLSEKKYQSLYELKTLDFVVMFIPLEPAFMVAVTNDSELFQHAWEKNVLLVSPSTLLFVIRTVASLWQQENISRNAIEISKRGGQLYDKLVGFVDDLQKVGRNLQLAQDSYQDAKNKFCQGTGTVIRQAEILKNLGVKATKKLPAKWSSGEDEDVAGELAEGSTEVEDTEPAS